MADHAGDVGEIFVYRGGRAPRHVTHVCIDISVDEIEDRAFEDCENLVQVDTHDASLYRESISNLSSQLDEDYFPCVSS